MGLAGMAEMPGRATTMKNVKGIKVIGAECLDGIVTGVIHITGSVKESEVNPKWVAEKLQYTVKIRVPLEDALELYAADLRIAIAGKLRKCSGEFVESLRGESFTLAGLETMIDAATPETAGTGAKAQAAKLRAVLKGMGMSDEEIDRKLAEVA